MSASRVPAFISDNIKSVIQASPSTSTVVKTPLPAGTTEPEKENPKTVPPPVDTVNPAASASPPEALTTPSRPNWKPAISVSLLYSISTV